MPCLRDSALPNCLTLSCSSTCRIIQHRSAHWGPSSEGFAEEGSPVLLEQTWSCSQCPTPQQPPAAMSNNCAEAPEQSLDQTKGFLVPTAGSGWRLLSPYNPCQDNAHDTVSMCWTSEASTHALVALSEHRADSNLSTGCRLPNSGRTLNTKAKRSPWSVIVEILSLKYGFLQSASLQSIKMVLLVGFAFFFPLILF